ncbi:hypothetical protein HN873_063085 [Arachis hypogaea]
MADSKLKSVINPNTPLKEKHYEDGYEIDPNTTKQQQVPLRFENQLAQNAEEQHLSRLGGGYVQVMQEMQHCTLELECRLTENTPCHDNLDPRVIQGIGEIVVAEDR